MAKIIEINPGPLSGKAIIYGSLSCAKVISVATQKNSTLHD